MKLYPIMFSFRDAIVGNGFVAAVEMDGRAVLAEDGQESWVYGVQPGGVAGGATSRPMALSDFKKGYLSVLFDIASESTSFAEFKVSVEALFHEINLPNQSEWDRALEEVRKNNTTLTDLKTIKAEAKPPCLTIEEMRPARANSGVNQFDQFSEAA